VSAKGNCVAEAKVIQTVRSLKPRAEPKKKKSGKNEKVKKKKRKPRGNAGLKKSSPAAVRILKGAQSKKRKPTDRRQGRLC